MEEIFAKILEKQGNCHCGNGRRKKGWKEQLKAEYERDKSFFVNYGRLSQFDFSNDCYNHEYMEEDDPICKYLLYKVAVASKNKTNMQYTKAKDFIIEKREICNGIVDPDSKSILLQILYKDLYGKDKYGKDFCENDLFINSENNIQGDTMNSVQSVLNSYIELCLEKKNRDFKEIRKNSQVSFGYFLELFCQDKDNICKELKEVNAPELMKTYHTLGNFIVIPTGCNVPRGRCILKDFWDLTLACIYNWYAQKEKREDGIIKAIGDMPLKYNIGMIFKKESDLEKYKKWLNMFGTWDKFVEDNCLGDDVNAKTNDILVNFVKKKSDGHYGRPKELWPGHFEGKVMPATPEEYKEYFTNSSKYIKNRGIIMHEKKLKNKKEIMPEMLNSKQFLPD